MPRLTSESHLAFIRQLPCLICLNDIETQACHVRYSDSRFGKVNPGLAQKPHDMWTLPMCGRHHDLQHSMNEKRFWTELGIDPLPLCLALWHISGQFERADRLIRSYHSVATR